MTQQRLCATIAGILLLTSCVSSPSKPVQQMVGSDDAIRRFQLDEDTKAVKGKMLPPELVKNTAKEEHIKKIRARGKDFSHKVDRGLAEDAKYKYFKGANKQVDIIDPAHTIVCFYSDATDLDVERFLKDHNATITKTLTTEPKSYYISFDYSKVSFSDSEFVDNLERRGYSGSHSFSDDDAKKLYYIVSSANNNADKYKISGVGLDVANLKVDYDGTHSEGSGYVTPSSAFWYLNNMSSPAFTGGNDFNSYLGCTLEGTSDSGVKVAVIDQNFYAAGESHTTYNPQLLGTWGTWGTYNATNGTNNIVTFADHGRGVASVLFSAVGDGQATAGVASHATPYLIHTGASGLSSHSVALNWCNTNNIKVVNCSWSYLASSSTGAYDLSIYPPIATAAANGRIIVAAAGNHGDQSLRVPAMYGEVIAVSAHNSNGTVALLDNGYYANKSSWVDLWAAGDNIVVANSTAYPNIGATTKDGTSYAAPLVAGTIARMVTLGMAPNRSTALQHLRDRAWVYTKNGYTYYTLDARYSLMW